MAPKRERASGDSHRAQRLAAAADLVHPSASQMPESPAGGPGLLGHLQRRAGNQAVNALLASAQTKLSVGAAGDTYEREADQVAQQVVRFLRQGSSATDQQADPEPKSQVARRLQRRSTIGAEGGELDSGTESMLQSARSGGRPLDQSARRQMESAFGADFSGVRVHSGETASALNQQLQAEAFTVGNDIFFRSSPPDSTSEKGQELLAHELTHVVQQNGPGTPPS